MRFAVELTVDFEYLWSTTDPAPTSRITGSSEMCRAMRKRTTEVLWYSPPMLRWALIQLIGDQTSLEQTSPASPEPAVSSDPQHEPQVATRKDLHACEEACLGTRRCASDASSAGPRPSEWKRPFDSSQRRRLRSEGTRPRTAVPMKVYRRLSTICHSVGNG